eukprot:scaffold23658_cov19-Prasinocladus_malaysianus.AAC.2
MTRETVCPLTWVYSYDENALTLRLGCIPDVRAPVSRTHSVLPPYAYTTLPQLAYASVLPLNSFPPGLVRLYKDLIVWGL